MQFACLFSCIRGHAETPSIPTALASELRVVLGQLVRRLRAEHRFPLSQGAVLGRLDREGPPSIGELAAAERVRPQSMAQTVADLEADGLIARRPDPADGRRTLVELTDARTRDARTRTAASARAGWPRAIGSDLSRAERRQLASSVELLRRLAER